MRKILSAVLFLLPSFLWCQNELEEVQYDTVHIDSTVREVESVHSIPSWKSKPGDCCKTYKTTRNVVWSDKVIEKKYYLRPRVTTPKGLPLLAPGKVENKEACCDTTIVNVYPPACPSCCDTVEWILWRQFYPMVELERHGLSQQLLQKSPEVGLGVRVNGRIDQIAPTFVPSKTNYFLSVEASLFREREIDESCGDTCGTWTDIPDPRLVGKLAIAAGREWGYPYQKLRGYIECEYDLLIGSEIFPDNNLWLRGGLRFKPIRFLELSGFAQLDGFSLLKGQQFLGGGATLRVMIQQWAPKPKGKNYDPKEFKERKGRNK